MNMILCIIVSNQTMTNKREILVYVIRTYIKHYITSSAISFYGYVSNNIETMASTTSRYKIYKLTVRIRTIQYVSKHTVEHNTRRRYSAKLWQTCQHHIKSFLCIEQFLIGFMLVYMLKRAK